MKTIAIVLCLLLLTGCASSVHAEPAAPTQTTAAADTVPSATAPSAQTIPPTTEPADPIREMLSAMSLEQRVGQLFLARCNNATALEHIAQYHLAGFVLFGTDFDGQTPQSIVDKLTAYQVAADIPLLLAVDEEGGTVTRVSRLKAFRTSPFPSPRESFASGGLDQALAVEEEKCQLLGSLGINVNLGPVCDITTDSTAFLYQRSLGQDALTTGTFAASTVRLMSAYRMGSVLKHFPGYGNNADTHTGIAVDSRPLAQLEAEDLIPFRMGFEAGAGAVMVSHTIVQALDDQMPASLSPAVHAYIRNNLGYDGVILTDDLVMQAITDQYGAGEAAVLAVLAGNDLLCSTDYPTQYEAVLDAVLDGRIDIDTLNRAVGHVLQWKQFLGLL